MTMNRYTVPISTSPDTAMVANLCLSVTCSVRSYSRSRPSKKRSNAVYIRPWPSSRGGRRNRLDNIGVRLSETKPETRMATLIVTANSCSRRPTRPPMKSTGMNTAARDSVIETMVKPISLAPLNAACIGRSPSSM